MNKSRWTPHFAAMCRLSKQIHETNAWDGGKESDAIYEQCEFHWDHMTDEEKQIDWQFSILLFIAEACGKKDKGAYPPNEGYEIYQGEDFRESIRLCYQLHKLQDSGVEDDGKESKECDDIRDQADVHWYKMNEEEMRIVRLFSSLLNLTEKKEIVK